MKWIHQIRQNDLSKKWFWIAVLSLTLLRLAMVTFQMGYYTPDLAPLDDTLLYNMAVSITQGEWLGEYGWLTLSKHSFFALWLAVMHWLHIPYLIGGQMLYAGACAAMVGAFAPVLQKNKSRLIFYSVMLYNPAAVGAFTLRVYRDNIFPALCLLVFAGIAGFVLRCTQKWTLSWLLLCGIGMGMVWLCREDGIWVIPFVAAAAVIAVWRLVISTLSTFKKAVRMVLLLLPAAVFALCLMSWAAMNNLYYGRFVVSDFTSSDFAQAYGALTRVKAGQEKQTGLIQIPLTKQGRQALYEAGAESFSELQPWLEDPSFQNGYANLETGEYPAGAFYWALRRAAQEAGHYDTAQEAKEYFLTMAREGNTLCDSGVLEAYPPRSGTTPRITARYVLPVVKEGLYSLWFCATMQDVEPYMDSISIGRWEDQIAPMEEFLYTKSNLACKEGSDEPYYAPRQELVFGGLKVVQMLYRFLLPLAILGAAIRLCRCARSVFLPQMDTQWKAAWIAVWGLFAMAVLRSMMVAFMEVASFGIGTSAMYLSTVHPLLLAASLLALLLPWPSATKNSPADC